MASKGEAVPVEGDTVTWTGVKGKTYSGTVLRSSGLTLTVLTDNTQNVMSFTYKLAKAAGLRLAK